MTIINNNRYRVRITYTREGAWHCQLEVCGFDPDYPELWVPVKEFSSRYYRSRWGARRGARQMLKIFKRSSTSKPEFVE